MLAHRRSRRVAPEENHRSSSADRAGVRDVEQRMSGCSNRRTLVRNARSPGERTEAETRPTAKTTATALTRINEGRREERFVNNKEPLDKDLISAEADSNAW